MKYWAFLAVVLNIITIGCSQSRSHKDSMKFDQYLVQGEFLYKDHCSNCHRLDGSGLRRLIPPLNNSDYIDNNRDHVICLIRYGLNKPILVNGIEFSQAMPENKILTDLEIAQISTYLYNSWGREQGLIDIKEVTSTLKSCSSVSDSIPQ